MLCTTPRASLLAILLCGALHQGTCMSIRSRENLGDSFHLLTEQVANGTHSQKIVSAWSAHVSKLTGKLQHGAKHRDAFRILVVSVVNDSPEAAKMFDSNVRTLEKNGAGDTFDYAFFHYDGKATSWEKFSWYTNTAGPVVLRYVGPICKSSAWYRLKPSLVSNYDYVWLMDRDLSLEYFSWDLYRTLLAKFEPLVSQPSVIPHVEGGQSTRVRPLQMSPASQGSFEYAREVDRSETQTPVLSSRVWPALQERLKGNDLRTNWFVTGTWDMSALLSKLTCNRPGILVVNAAPVRHMDYHDLLTSDSGCTHGAGERGENRRPISRLEMAASLSGLSGYCDIDVDSSLLGCMGTIQECKKALLKDMAYQTWTEPAD